VGVGGRRIAAAIKYVKDEGGGEARAFWGGNKTWKTVSWGWRQKC